MGRRRQVRSCWEGRRHFPRRRDASLTCTVSADQCTFDGPCCGRRALLFGGFQGRGTAALFALALACEAAGIALYAWAGGTHAPAGGGDTSTPPLGAPYEQIEVVPLVSGGGGNSSDSDVHRPHGQARVAQATTKAGAGDGEDEEQAWLLPAGSLSTR